MKDMAIHTRVNPGERIKRLTKFANRLLSTPEVKLFLNELVKEVFNFSNHILPHI